MASATLVFPGDTIPPSSIPQTPKKALMLGPGLRPSADNSVVATVAGALATDARKKAIWIEHNSGRYIPHLNDVVIATVQNSAFESYQCALTPHGPLVSLPHLAFDAASKKTRPHAAAGALVYARVSAAGRDLDQVELSCESAAAAAAAEGLGVLKGGMLFAVSAGLARRLLLPEARVAAPAAEGGGALVVLQGLAEGLAFEAAVGRNGRVWVRGADVRSTLLVGAALRETDERQLSVAAQRKLAAALLRDHVHSTTAY